MNFKHSNGILGFVYLFKCIGLDGKIRWEERMENIIPNEGRDYILNAALNGGSQYSTWYIGLFEGSYTPVAGDGAATFPGSATETTAYTSSTRPVLNDGALVSGLWANVASPASFVFSADKTIRGGFISSLATKGGVSGVLLSAVLGSSPKSVDSGETLQVTSGLTLITA